VSADSARYAGSVGGGGGGEVLGDLSAAP